MPHGWSSSPWSAERSEPMRPGLADPVLDNQRIFRGVLDAMSHPGRIVALAADDAAPGALYPATDALGLDLVELDTALRLDSAGHTTDGIAHFLFHGRFPFVDYPSPAL